MNSMFDRLGEFLRDYIDEDGQDIFDNPQETEESEKINEEKVFEQNHFETKTEETYTKKEDANKTEFKFDTSKQQFEYKNTENSQQKKINYTKTQKNKTQTQQKTQTTGKRYYVPFELYEDFKTLCLMPGTNLEECKIAYKTLLKKFHPDKFANEPEKQKEATEITSSITSAFTRIKTWYEENLQKS